MAEYRDTTVIELHWIPSSPVVAGVEGDAYRVSDEGKILGRLEPASQVAVGETLVLEPAAQVRVGDLVLQGGRRGRAHQFVAESAFRTGPGPRDVPKLLAQLGEIERQMEARLGEDPLALQKPPTSPIERASCAEFARQNLDVEAARRVPRQMAESLGAVCLFLNSESAFVAFSTITIAKLRILMEQLGRPISSHLVEESVLMELLARVYGVRGTPS